MTDTTTIDGGPAGAPQAPAVRPLDLRPMVDFLARLAAVTVRRDGLGTCHPIPVETPLLRADHRLDGSVWATLDIGQSRIRWKLRNADHEGPWRGWSPR